MTEIEQALEWADRFPHGHNTILAKAYREQQASIKSLETRISELESQNRLLENESDEGLELLEHSNELQVRIKELEAELKTANDKQKGSIKEIVRWKDEIMRLDSLIANFEKQNKKLKEDIEISLDVNRRQWEYQQKQQAIIKIKEDDELEICKEIDLLEAKIKELEVNLLQDAPQLINRNIDLETRIKELEVENEVLSLHIDDRKKDLARIAALEMALNQLHRNHEECEDPWYSCPKSIEGCINDSLPKNICNCGADTQNKFIEKALSDSKLSELFQALLQFHKYRVSDPQWNKVEVLRKECGLL